MVSSSENVARSRQASYSLRNPWVLIGVYVLLGGLSVVLYYEMPIVRLSAIYARIVYALADLGAAFDASEHAFNKALGFPLLAYPFVVVLGANLGLKLVSFLSTALWVVTTLIFFQRLQRRFLWPQHDCPGYTLLLIVLLLNPLVFYQFVSAYPDTLNALAFLWAVLFLDRWLSKECRWYDPLLFCAITLIAIWIKHHGFILLVIMAVFAGCRLDILAWQWRHRREVIWNALFALALLAVTIILAQGGKIPFFNLSENKSNFGKGFAKGAGKLTGIIVENLGNLRTYLLLTLSTLSPLLLRLKSRRRFKEWYIMLAIFVVTILVYHGTRYNIRYYLPIAPLLVWIVCLNLNSLPRALRATVLAGFVGINLFTTLYYNSVPAYETVSPVLRLPEYDNLRLVDEQRDSRKDISTINRLVSATNNMLFFSAEQYYGNGLWHVWEREGLFDPGLQVAYMRPLDWAEIQRRLLKENRTEALLYTPRWIYKKKRGRKPGAIDAKRLSDKVYRLRRREPSTRLKRQTSPVPRQKPAPARRQPVPFPF